MLSINKLPVFLQNRNGNTPESYDQLSLITQALAGCAGAGLTVKRFRADACCYEKKTVEYLGEKHLTYYLRCELNASLSIALEDGPEWQWVLPGHRKVEVCSIEEPLFEERCAGALWPIATKQKGNLPYWTGRATGTRLC